MSGFPKLTPLSSIKLPCDTSTSSHPQPRPVLKLKPRGEETQIRKDEQETCQALYNKELYFLKEEEKSWNKANLAALAGDHHLEMKPKAERVTPG